MKNRRVSYVVDVPPLAPLSLFESVTSYGEKKPALHHRLLAKWISNYSFILMQQGLKIPYGCEKASILQLHRATCGGTNESGDS